MKLTTTNRAFKRLGFLIASAVITALISWASGEYQTSAIYPIVYFLFTTARDYLDKNIPNS